LPTDFNEWPPLVGTTVDIYPITKRGKPEGELLGFICAKCLKDANAMRVYMKTFLRKVRITHHAVQRFLQRQRGEPVSEESARVAIIKVFDHARLIRFKDEFMFRRMLNNECEAADYYYHGGWILVVSREHPPVIVTMERAGFKKLGRDFYYYDPDSEQS
jgi:hypothetical protein